MGDGGGANLFSAMADITTERCAKGSCCVQAKRPVVVQDLSARSGGSECGRRWCSSLCIGERPGSTVQYNY